MINIRKYRKAAGLTQSQLAEKVGVTPTAITQYESGDRKPNIIMLKKIATSLNCSTDELLETINV